MAGLRMNRNRLQHVVNMKLHKLHKRKTVQDKYKESGKPSCTHAHGHGKKD
jgi:hypothetical protein